MKKQKISGIRRALFAALAALAAALLTYWAPFRQLEYSFADSIFIRPQPVDNRVKIIGIDEESLQKMGPFSSWTRQQAADLLNAFDPEYAPAVIAFDINYFNELEPEGDNALVEAVSKYEYVVMGSDINYTTKLEQMADGTLWMNTMYVEQIERPYEALAAVTRQGFTDAVSDSDNYVRRSMLWAEADGIREYNFSWTIYSNYCESIGEQPVFPKTDTHQLYGFDYTAEPGMYEIYSYADVVDGRINKKVFQGSIVLVGAYASGMMDKFMVPIARSAVMNGVEVHANHVNALLDGRTFTELPVWICVLLAAVTAGAYTWLAFSGNFAVNIGSAVVLELAVPFAARMLYRNGLYWRCLMIMVTVAVVFLIRLAFGYLSEWFRKRKILQMFCTYMAPQVVDELSRSGNYQIELGGRELISFGL